MIVYQLAFWPPDRTIVLGSAVRTPRIPRAARAWCPACKAFIEVTAKRPEHSMSIHYRRTHDANWSTDPNPKVRMLPPQARTDIRHRLLRLTRAAAVDLHTDPHAVLATIRHVVASRSFDPAEGQAQRALRERLSQSIDQFFGV